MNCPKDRSKLEYVSELSDPRRKKTIFYCHKCQAFRAFFEPAKDQLFTLLLDAFDFGNILPSWIRKRLNEKDAIPNYPLSMKREVFKGSS